MINNIGINNCLNGRIDAIEYFDKDKLWHILKNKSKFQKILNQKSEIPDGNNTDMLERVRKYFMMSLNQGIDGRTTKTGHINVSYNNRNNAGRLFADCCLSLQNINHKIRHTIGGEYYIDVDMVNAHPVILEYICKELKIKCPYLSFYNLNREKIFKKYLEVGFERDDIKKLMLVIINGGSGIYKKVRRKKVEIELNAFNSINTLNSVDKSNSDNTFTICKFRSELSDIRLRCRTQFKDRYELIKEQNKDLDASTEFNVLNSKKEIEEDTDSDEQDSDWANYEGKLISSLMCDGESIILNTMIDFFKENGMINKMGKMDAILCFDGIMLNKKYIQSADRLKSEFLSSSGTTDRLLKKCEKEIKNKTGVDIILKVKPMNKGLSSIQKVSGATGDRPNPRNDVFLYEEYFNQSKTWEKFCKLKHELIRFINKDTYIIRGSTPMIIKETIKYDNNSIGNANIDRIFKTDKGYSTEMANIRFKGKISDDEIKKYNIKSSDLNVEGYKSWIQSKYRNDKDQIIFDPDYFYKNKSTDNIYNLFNGLNIERDNLTGSKILDPETCPFFQHILNMWCNGHVDEYNYVLNWFASIIQFPWRKLRSCIVLKSTERAGKGVIIDKIREILGENYIFHPTSPKDILGDFNVGCRNKLLIFLDELVWGGDKERAGTFKKLITEKYISINEKFKSIFIVKNLINVVIASNEAWVVPAGTTDTRWFVLKLNSYLARCSKAEKRKIVNEILETDTKCLAKFFYERDITNWDSDDIIITDELREQRIQSMNPLNKWWFDCLNDGYLYYNNKKYYFDLPISKAILFSSYIESSNDRHIVKRSFNKTMMELLGNPETIRHRVDGRQIRCYMLPKIEASQNIWKNIYADNDWIFDDVEMPNESDTSADSESESD